LSTAESFQEFAGLLQEVEDDRMMLVGYQQHLFGCMRVRGGNKRNSNWNWLPGVNSVSGLVLLLCNINRGVMTLHYQCAVKSSRSCYTGLSGCFKDFFLKHSYSIITADALFEGKKSNTCWSAR
jgi:hypothetical protein